MRKLAVRCNRNNASFIKCLSNTKTLFWGVSVSVIGQSNPSPYGVMWKTFLPLYKTVYPCSSRKQGWSMQKRNIYKSHLWCQTNEMWAMNHEEGWAGSAFHYHNWPTSWFASTAPIPSTHFKLKSLKISHFEVSVKYLRRSPKPEHFMFRHWCLEEIQPVGLWSIPWLEMSGWGKGKVSKFFFISFIFHPGMLGILPHQ